MWQVATKMWQMIDFDRAKTSCYGWGLLFFLVVQNSVHKYKYKFHTSASKETTGSLERDIMLACLQAWNVLCTSLLCTSTSWYTCSAACFVSSATEFSTGCAESTMSNVYERIGNTLSLYYRQ